MLLSLESLSLLDGKECESGDSAAERVTQEDGEGGGYQTHHQLDTGTGLPFLEEKREEVKQEHTECDGDGGQRVVEGG